MYKVGLVIKQGIETGEIDILILLKRRRKSDSLTKRVESVLNI